MKRSPLPPRKKPIARGALPKRKAPIAIVRSSRKKPARAASSKPDPRYRNSSYLAWVKTLPCVLCHGPADDPHHLIGVGQLGGMGTKAPDTFVMPVCREDHDRIHRTPDLWPEQWKWVAKTLARAVEEGVL